VESTLPNRILPLEPCFPQWVQDVFGTPVHWVDVDSLRVAQADYLTLISATISDAVAMSAADLTSEVARVYRLLLGRLASSASTPIRFWNYIPSIGAPMGQGLDRYMVFNAGRYDAFARTGPRGGLPAPRRALGRGGRRQNLVIHCRIGRRRRAGRNPRQARRGATHRDSGYASFFARGRCRLGDRRLLLIAGTASIVETV
jgi:hypothetical protein